MADKVLDAVLGKDDWYINEPYREALRNHHIFSETWNWVGCTNNEEAILKLQIIKKCLLTVKVSNRENLILCRYIGGLRKIAQYRILELMGYSEEPAMDELAKLPF